MAYIRKHGDGWRVEVQRNGQRTSKKFPTKREAQQWALEQEAQAKAISHGWHTFAQAADRYEEEVTPTKKGVIDHINRSRRDNRISNLRDVSSYLNSKNTGQFSSNSSGMKGVSFHRAQGMWHAHIIDQGVRHFLGAYKTKDEAGAAREGADRVLFYLRGVAN